VDAPSRFRHGLGEGIVAEILVIEDDPDVLQVVSAVLRAAGHAVVAVHDGRDAVQLLEGDAPLDLVVTDLFMPHMDGFEAILAIRRTRPELRVVAMSGGALAGRLNLLEAARGLGVSATLRKPFRSRELLAVVDRVLQGDTPVAP